MEKLKTKSQLLIKTLTYDSGRNVFSTIETENLVEISYLEGIGAIEEMNEKIKIFKSRYVLKEDEWLD